MSTDEVSAAKGYTNESITYSMYGRFAPEALQDAAEILKRSEVREVRTQVQ